MGSAVPMELLLEASVVGADDEGFDLRWGNGVRARWEPPGGITAKDYELFGLEPPGVGGDDRGAGTPTAAPIPPSFTATPAPTPPDGSLLAEDATGLWHTPDYSVCRERRGKLICLDPVGAKVVEAFNSWLSQGLLDVRFEQLLQEMRRLSQPDPEMLKEIHRWECLTTRPDHLFARLGLWKTLVMPGGRRKTYRLIV